MYRALLPDGDLECDRYERGDYGVDLYTENDDHVAFVPYTNLIALVNEEVESHDDPSIL